MGGPLSERRRAGLLIYPNDVRFRGAGPLRSGAWQSLAVAKRQGDQCLRILGSEGEVSALGQAEPYLESLNFGATPRWNAIEHLQQGISKRNQLRSEIVELDSCSHSMAGRIVLRTSDHLIERHPSDPFRHFNKTRPYGANDARIPSSGPYGGGTSAGCIDPLGALRFTHESCRDY
jgi:hypothetical protein